MKKEFSQQEIEQILKNDAVIPASVDERIKETYDRLGLASAAREGHGRDSASLKTRPVRMKKKKVWVTIAAAAALTAGLGITAFAVSQFLKVDLTEKDGELSYDVAVDTTVKEAHKVTAEPTYVPEGFVYHTDGPYQLKWHNDSNDGSMNIIVYNAADLYTISKTDRELSVAGNKDNYVKTASVSGMDVDIFSSESIYTDEDRPRQDVYLSNEEYGYLIHVFLEAPGLAEGEALKVAEALDIQVSDETVPWPAEEEIAESNGLPAGSFDSVWDESLFYAPGDAITDPQSEESTVEFRVKDVHLADSLPLDQFPKENYIDDYDSTVAPLLNGDGTLKPHERYSLTDGNLSGDGIESADSRFIVATVEITNTGDDASEEYISPSLEYLRSDDSQGYVPFDITPAAKAYARLTMDGAPIYQSVQQFTEGQKTHVRFIDLDAGETVECTFAWVVEDDCADSAYLAFFDMYGGMTNSYPRVKVTE